jgi:hypothetical protein
LVLRSPGSMLGYLPEFENDSAFLADGSFRTGDLGWIDADGWVHLTDRIRSSQHRGEDPAARIAGPSAHLGDLGGFGVARPGAPAGPGRAAFRPVVKPSAIADLTGEHRLGVPS